MVAYIMIHHMVWSYHIPLHTNDDANYPYPNYTFVRLHYDILHIQQYFILKYITLHYMLYVWVNDITIYHTNTPCTINSILLYITLQYIELYNPALKDIISLYLELQLTPYIKIWNLTLNHIRKNYKIWPNSKTHDFLLHITLDYTRTPYNTI